MPKVVMINTVVSGSHGRIMRDLRDAAEQYGFETTIAYGRGAGCDGDTIQIDSKAEVLSHVALTRTLDRHARGSRSATKRLVQQLDTIRPDFIHLHNVHGYYLHAETLFDYIRTRSIPTVWTHHDCWAFTGHCSHFVRAYCDRWQTGCHDCPLKHEYPASYGLDASRTNWQWKKEAFTTVPSLRIISPSLWLHEVIGKSYLREIPRMVIPSGVDLTLFKPADVDTKAIRAQNGVRPEQALLLGVAAPFDERKGLSDAIAVAEKLQHRARVILVGLTKKQVAELPDSVTGIERTDGPEALVSLYNAADCLINPTYEDTYPTVNMEAMACGTPVAGYSVGGATEQLVQPCGMDIPVGNTDMLANAAMALATQKQTIRDACRTYAEEHFDRRTAINTYMNIYRTMAGV